MPRFTEHTRAIVTRQMRDAIRCEVLKLLDRDEEELITMDLIAARLDISKGTLYNYYKNKQELLEDAVTAIHAELHDRIGEISRAELGPDEKIIAYMELLFRNFDQLRPIYSLLYLSHRKTPLKDLVRAANIRLLHQELEKEITAGIEAGIFLPFEDLRATATCVYSTAIGLMQTIFFGDTDYRAPECHRIFRETVIYSLRRGGRGPR